MSEVAHPTARSALVGRMFVNPLFDYLLIGGGLSLVVVALVVMLPDAQNLGYMAVSDTSKTIGRVLPYCFLFSNTAHFAASTVRLYTKPGSYQALPFLTMSFPLVCLAILVLCIALPMQLGTNLTSLYLSWSPYHYAAQAYGLAVMYSYRGGYALDIGDKRLLRAVCLIPFVYNLLIGPEVGLSWLTPIDLAANSPGTVRLLTIVLGGAAALATLYMFLRLWRKHRSPMPLISVLLVVTNGMWWFVLGPLEAFVYATVFHGIQYLAIVAIFHIKDQVARPENQHGTLYHALWFYGVCLALGYGLFFCLPQGFLLAGFDGVESLLLTVAAINIHHFIVDGYIWKLGRKDPNRRIVDSSGSPRPTAA